MKPKSKKFILLSIGLFILIIFSTVVRVYSDEKTEFIVKNRFLIKQLAQESEVIILGKAIEQNTYYNQLC